MYWSSPGKMTWAMLLHQLPFYIYRSRELHCATSPIFQALYRFCERKLNVKRMYTRSICNTNDDVLKDVSHLRWVRIRKYWYRPFKMMLHSIPFGIFLKVVNRESSGRHCPSLNETIFWYSYIEGNWTYKFYKNLAISWQTKYHSLDTSFPKAGPVTGSNTRNKVTGPPSSESPLKDFIGSLGIVIGTPKDC